MRELGARDLVFESGMVREANALVMRYHYSKRLPSNVQYVGSFHRRGGMFGAGAAVAAAFFAIPPTRWSEPVLELIRLVRADDVRIPLTRLVSLCCGELKRRGADLLVSFADRTHGHHGGIYQACSWNYAGCRDRACDGVLIGGVFHPGRSCNSTWGTRSPQKLADILGVEVLPHYDEGKHLYWKPLTKAGKQKAARLQLACAPYPKEGLCTGSA